MTRTYQIAHGSAAVQAARIIASVAKEREAAKKDGVVYDKTGREILLGDVLKVFHFTAALRRKKHFMYKQAVAYDWFKDGTPYLKISHLDMSDDTYTVICDGSHLADYEIVQSANVPIESRPRHVPVVEAA